MEELENQEKFQQAINAAAEAFKTTASENLNIIRSMSSEVLKRIDLRVKENQSLKNEKNALQAIRAEIGKINKIAEQSFNFTQDRLSLLQSEEQLQKRLEASRQNILSLSREISTLQVRIQVAKTEGDDLLVKNLKGIQRGLFDVRDEAKGFNDEIKRTIESVKKIEDIPEVKFFTQLERLSRNVPFISGFIEDALEALKRSEREALSQENLAKEILKSKNLLDEQGKFIGTSFSEAILGEIKDEFEIDFDKDVLGKVFEGKGSNIARASATKRFLEGEQPKERRSTFSIASEAVIGNLKTAFNSITLISGVTFQIVRGFLQANRELVEIQKSFALTSNEALGLRNELVRVANDTANINITATKLLQTVTELSEQFGFVAKFSNETLVTMTKLTQQVGLSAEAAGMLAAESVIIDGSFEDIYKNTLAASYELQQQTGVQFDLRKILEATAKVTGQVRANLEGNPVEIAKAVTQAKLFGAELDDIVATSRALLDFQSSIESELQAELLLGRDINLEMARQAALMGDQEEVAKQLTRQVGDFGEFTKLNVIQQDALAQAVGMTSDRLADILFQQEIQGRTARELRALGKEELADRLEAQTLQEKFAAATDKLKAVVVDLVAAFSPMIDVASELLYVVGEIAKVLSPIMGILVGAGTGALIGGPLGAVIGGLAGGFSDVTRMNDGIISDGRVITGPEGTFKLPVEDSIIAGTDLFGQTPLSQMPDYQSVINNTNLVSPQIQNQQQTTQTINQNFEGFIERIEKVEAAINNQTKVLAKGQDTIAKTKTTLQVGATDFGTDLNINSFRIQ